VFVNVRRTKANSYPWSAIPSVCGDPVAAGGEVSNVYAVHVTPSLLHSTDHVPDAVPVVATKNPIVLAALVSCVSECAVDEMLNVSGVVFPTAAPRCLGEPDIAAHPAIEVANAAMINHRRANLMTSPFLFLPVLKTRRL
jgi:hypothetical protein